MTSIFVRSLIYNVLFYVLLVFWILVAIPTFVMPPRAFMAIAKAWATSSIWLMRVVCNTKVDYRGLERIPAGPLIVASKHQSMWETFARLMASSTMLTRFQQSNPSSFMQIFCGSLALLQTASRPSSCRCKPKAKVSS